MLRKKSKLYKNYIKTHSIDAKLKFVKYRNKLKSILVKAERDFYSTKLQACTSDPRKTWNVLNQILHRSKRSALPEEFVINDVKVNDGNIVAEKFNEYFSNIGKHLAAKISPSRTSFYDYVRKKTSYPNSIALFNTSSDEITSIVSSLKNTSSIGTDEVPVQVIKAVIPQIASPLATVFNFCLQAGEFPDALKVAKVCPVYKSGDKEDITNYRPISILPCFSKIFEKIIHARLSSYIDLNGILSSCQYGFRQNFSTYMPMINLYNRVTEVIEKMNTV